MRLVPPIDNRTAAIASAALLGSASALLVVGPAARPVVLPLLAVANLFLFLVVLLHGRDRRLPVFEIGPICAGLISLYAAVPLLGFWLGGLKWSAQSDALLLLNPPSTDRIAAIAWRYVLYLASFIAAYLFLRGRPGPASPRLRPSDSATWMVVVAATLGSAAVFLLVFAASGVPYNPSYARLRAGPLPAWESLPALVQLLGKGASWLLLVSKLCLLALLFHSWAGLKQRVILFAWLALETGWAVSVMGSRREVAMLLCAAVLLYHRFVRPLAVGRAATLAPLLVSAVLAFGFLRDFGGERVSWTAANEFQTVFANACDIAGRRAGLEVPWQLHYADLLRLVPRRWLDPATSQVFDPSYWYLDRLGIARAPGVGRMFGVVAQAMVGRDWLELAARGILLGF
ncbi:MAG TPA: hypothetical protein VFO85_02915, partial [Vicinamibacteria bacterium]|nr:hypothetical protein [Vicinamibacteria bacterium]